MARGLDASDWTVSQRGDEGTIRSDEYRGRFRVRRPGLVQIIRQDGPESGEYGPVDRAAQEGIAAAIRPRE